MSFYSIQFSCMFNHLLLTIKLYNVFARHTTINPAHCQLELLDTNLCIVIIEQLTFL